MKKFSAARWVVMGAGLGAMVSNAQAFDFGSGKTNFSLSGRVVAGVEYIDNVGAGGGTTIRSASNQWGTSMLTLKGSSQVNDSLQGTMHLETGFGANNGNNNDGSGSNLFSRFATVGVASKNWGSLNFGRALSISNDVWYLDPMGQNWSGSALLVQGRSWNNTKSSVNYRSLSFGGFDFGAQLGFGEQSGNSQANRKLGVSASYTAGPLNIRAIYDEARDPKGGYSNLYVNSKETILGATYQAGPAKIFAAYNRLTAPNAVVSAVPSGSPAGNAKSGNHYWVGVNYDVTRDLMLRAATYRLTLGDGQGNAGLTTLGLDYKIDSNLLLWSTFAAVRNSNVTNYSAINYWDNLPKLGGSQQGVNVGFAYSF